MKKVLLMSLACCMAAMAQAKILRVSNVTGSTAPYKTLADAYTAAKIGDTILVDGSSYSYGDFKISNTAKPIVLLGSGYDLRANNITDQNNSDVILDYIEVYAKGSIIQGITFKTINASADNIVINRCKGGVIRSYISQNISGLIVHQCIFDRIYSQWGDRYIMNSQITNNIITHEDSNISDVSHSVIHNNTFVNWITNSNRFNRIYSCSIKYNSAGYNFISDGVNQNEVANNYVPEDCSRFIDLKLDSEFMEADAESTANGYGAFAGTDPYVISGVPAGPVIEDIEMPVSVEKGKKLEVTVKVKIQK